MLGELIEIEGCVMTGHSEKQYCSSLPHSVWSADWIRQAEPAAAATLGLSLYSLMERAGAAAYELACDRYPASRHWLVLCGHGNNGGDGYVVARLARAAGIKVTLIACEGVRPLPQRLPTPGKPGWQVAEKPCQRPAVGQRMSISSLMDC